MTDQCCMCPSLYNRCQTDECACYSSGRPCQPNCETQKLSANCLNRPICRCNCSLRRLASPGPAKSPSHHHPDGGNVPKSHCDTNNCECFRYREPCTPQCGCKKEGCPHTKSAEKLYLKSKEHRAVKGCKCGSGKKSCHKSKCPCRQTLDHCSLACKCAQDCANAPNMPLSKVGRQCFTYPETDTTAIVVRFLGENHYRFQLEFVNAEKNSIHAVELLYETLLNVVSHFNIPLQHIVIFMSKSPCFHQDCDPKCEVLQHCEAQKACARLLAIAYAQTQRHLRSCNLRMTVKFLCPYVKRGDLYTQQGILHMMEAGIAVEPMVQKEWSDLLADPTIPGPPPVIVWADNNMEHYVRQSQHYINVCRHTLGLKPTQWASPFHELLKNTVLTVATSRRGLDNIAKHLRLQGEVEETQSRLRTSGSFSNIASVLKTDSTESQPNDDSLTYQAMLYSIMSENGSFKPEMLGLSTLPRNSSGYKTKSRARSVPGFKGQRSKTGGNLSVMFNSISADSPPSKDEPLRSKEISHPRQVERPDSDYSLNSTQDMESAENTLTRDPPINAERLLLNFSGRPISEAERKEIREHLANGVDKIRKELNDMLTFLEQRSSATPV